MSGLLRLTKKLSFTEKKGKSLKRSNQQPTSKTSTADSLSSDLSAKLFFGASTHSTQSTLTCITEEGDREHPVASEYTEPSRIRPPAHIWSSVTLKNKLGKSVNLSHGAECDATDISDDPARAWKMLEHNGMEAIKVPQESVLLSPESGDKVRIVCISDTHGRHAGMAHKIPPGDILIHAGDFTRAGAGGEIEDFLVWFASQPHKHKVLIAGNHDITLDSGFYDKNYRRFGHFAKYNQVALREAVRTCPGVIYLEDEVAEVLGLRIYGAPWQPNFCRWAFQKARGCELRTTWEHVPTDIDVLVTHGPPLGYGDVIHNGEHVGDVDLLREVQCRINPRVHIFGHVHESAGLFRHGMGGQEDESSTLFINASICTRAMHPRHAATYVDLAI